MILIMFVPLGKEGKEVGGCGFEGGDDINEIS